MNRDWTGKLKDRLQDYEEEAPEGLWNAISGSMTVRKRKRTAAYVISAMSVAAAVLLAVYFSTGRFSTNDTVHVQDLVAQQTPGTSAGTSSATSGIQQEYDAGNARDMDMAVVAVKSAASAIPYTEDTVREIPVNSGKDSQSMDTGTDSGKDDEVKADSGRRSAKDAGYGSEFNERNALAADISPEKKRKNRGTLHASISASNLAGTSRNYSAYAGLASASILSSRQSDETKESHGSVLLKSAPAPAAQENASETRTEIRHRQPVRAGVSVRYDFSDRWGIETGLAYSLLSSSIYSSNGGSSYRTEQNLHYIGIPLQLSYDFLQLKWFSMYVNAGGMMEKCVYGRSDTDYLYGGQTMSSSGRKVSIKPLQWSLNAAVGAEFHFSPLVGIYVEPGLSYFFDDKSDVSTIYKDKPLNFNLELGIRFSFR